MMRWLIAVAATVFTVSAFGAPPYVGTWAQGSDNCQAEGDNVPMQIEVTSILFYESRCDLKAIEQQGETWTAQGECSGEGETWNESIRMTVSDDTMIFSQNNEQGLRYIRCR
ncbi:MAG: hypothetical protein KFB96_07370 [Thiocapsa sp.]|uniref:hypothetical protein n=1 Tax=Thiocapsa sp. TaxID=2024551 RepID=UPI001BCB97B2|nr:hypothetical protein [Thiocapsa sp.]QVL50249.1 MAG: hypothetical protein KFB96_07370 [Thiocapsa sp.]